MIRFSDVAPALQPALVKFASFLAGEPVDAGASLDDLAKLYADAKGKQGRAAVATKLGMNDAELTMFDAALREGVRRVGRLAPDAPPYEQRNATIAGLRLLSWLESIADRAPDFAFEAKLPALDDEVGRKQIRALELIIRSLITEKYEDQPHLIARLKELLSEKVVQQWLAAADRGDVLSGTTFSELSSLFVSTQEFPNYEPIYKETPLLSLLKEKRVTIRNYLDDIRRIRNVLAHNKRVTPAQVSLLSMYYEELVEPLQEAHDQGRTKVNPDLYLDVSQEELAGYFGGLKDDLKDVKDDIADLRMELGGKLDEVKKDTSAIRETTTRIETGTQAANTKLWVTLAAIAAVIVVVGVTLYFVLGTSKTTGEIAGTTQKTNDTANRIEGQNKDIATSQARTEHAIGEIADAFKRIDKNGGVIETAASPAEHYHNAIVYEARGDSANARKEYMAFADGDIDAIDVFDRFARLVRVQDGLAGARELFASLSAKLKSPAVHLEYAMQFADKERTDRMEQFLKDNPSYGPGWYLLAMEYSAERTGGQSVADKQKELDYLKKFLAADQAGTLIPHFVDQQVLGEWLDKARQAVKLLEPQLQATRSQPTMNVMSHNGGFTITFLIPEPALKIFYRVGESGDFMDTGSTGVIDQRTGKEQPNSFIELQSDQGPTKIYLKYTNANGQEMGPFSYDFGGAGDVSVEYKRLLEMTWTGWVVIQPNPGNQSQILAYFTGMISYRCGIAKAMIGIDKETPDTEFKLPVCNPKDPMRIPDDAVLYLKVAPTLKQIVVQLTYKDGTQSIVHTYKPGQGG